MAWLCLCVRVCVTGVCAHTRGVWDVAWAPLGSVGPGRIVAFPLDMAMCEARQASQSRRGSEIVAWGHAAAVCLCCLRRVRLV